MKFEKGGHIPIFADVCLFCTRIIENEKDMSLPSCVIRKHRDGCSAAYVRSFSGYCSDQKRGNNVVLIDKDRVVLTNKRPLIPLAAQRPVTHQGRAGEAVQRKL